MLDPQFAPARGPAPIEPDTLPTSLHSQAHALTAGAFSIAAVMAAMVHATPRLTMWLWMNPITVVALLFALSVCAMTILPRLATVSVAVASIVALAQSMGMAMAAEAIFVRYVNVPAAPMFIVIAVQLASLAVIGNLYGAVLASDVRVMLAALATGAAATIVVTAPFGTRAMLWLVDSLAMVLAALLVSLDHARSRALARIARDRRAISASFRVAALLVFDVVYLPVLLPRLSSRWRRRTRH